jgi:predicted TIM-barrel fold metal-dependent hydrolase
MISEEILEPGLPIIDPHHHLWDRRQFASEFASDHGFNLSIRPAAKYLFEDFLADVTSGHNIVATVYLEAGAFYRADRTEPMKSLGETEFATGVAAMSASGLYGKTRVCAGIVGCVDLALGKAARPILEAHMAVAGDRYKGVRNIAPWDADSTVLGPVFDVPKGLYRDAAFREGFACLAPLGLSFDAWLLEPQLDDVIDLARAFENTSIVLDHVGTPLGIASYQGRREERFGGWRSRIRSLAELPNVTLKLGGLGMAFCNFPSFLSGQPASSRQLADEWRPYIEACVEAFGVDRCMFESNFPVDGGACDYATLWNAFKRLAAGASAAEKTALFSGTAQRTYRLDL